MSKKLRGEELEKYYRIPANRRLKHIAIGVMAVGIALMLAIIIWMDDISLRMMLFLRGCAGLCALAFVILCGVLFYRVYSAYIHDR